MWRAIISVTIWRAALLILAAFLVGTAGGALYMAMRQSAQQAAAKPVEKAVDKAVAVTDNAQVKQLQTQLAAAKSEATAFKTKLDEAARANPAPTQCRLSDSLRDDLNR